MILFEGDEFHIDFVDWTKALPEIAERPSGRLGLMRLPGLDPKELPAEIETIKEARTALLVSLLLSRELGFKPALMEDGIGLPSTLAREGIRHRLFPIPNLGVPESMPELADLVEDVVSCLRVGQTVAMHCLAGLGRTGLVAACCLVRLGLDPEEAILEVRRARPGAIETLAQEAFVGRYAAHLKENPPS